LIGDAEAVLGHLVPVERELQDDAGRWYLTRLHPYRSNDDRIEGVVVTFIDITDRKDAERMRLELQTQEQAAAAGKIIREKEGELARVSRTLMVGELASSIAHDVNQPLAGVVTNAEAGLRWLNGEKPNIPEAVNSLELIVRDGNRASAVIQRVREFVKSGSNGAEAVDLREVIRDTISLVRFDLEKQKVAVTQDLSEKLPLVHGDRVQFEQVILNLLVNSVEAMSSVNNRPREIVVKAQNSSDGPLVSIQDSGIGVDAAQIDKIYDAFFTTKPTGVGIGLSISRSIIQAHGGRIWAANNDGHGLTVGFCLPANNASDSL
jgi:signal transduction histidine kinase